MILLSKEQVKYLHSKLIEATGGSDGIRDEGLLESALATPFQTFGEEELYPSIPRKAARLCYGLIKNHVFIGSYQSKGGFFNGKIRKGTGTLAVLFYPYNG